VPDLHLTRDDEKPHGERAEEKERLDREEELSSIHSVGRHPCARTNNEKRQSANTVECTEQD
jgi:hypothetical protein